MLNEIFWCIKNALSIELVSKLEPQSNSSAGRCLNLSNVSLWIDLANPFTILDSHNQLIDEFYLVQNRRSSLERIGRMVPFHLGVLLRNLTEHFTVYKFQIRLFCSSEKSIDEFRHRKRVKCWVGCQWKNKWNIKLGPLATRWKKSRRIFLWLWLDCQWLINNVRWSFLVRVFQQQQRLLCLQEQWQQFPH